MIAPRAISESERSCRIRPITSSTGEASPAQRLLQRRDGDPQDAGSLLDHHEMRRRIEELTEVQVAHEGKTARGADRGAREAAKEATGPARRWKLPANAERRNRCGRQGCGYPMTAFR